MKQYGVSSATMALPAQFKGTVVNEPTAPDKPVAPDAFTMKAPVVTDYGLASSIKAMPTKLAKGQTQADLDAAQESWRQYQTALSDFNAKKTAYDDTKKTYATYTSGDVKDKSSYAYQQKQYQDALGKYKSYLDDKTSFDTSKGDVYNTYKTAYQDRIAQTPMYLQQQFTRASDVNPYEGMYSPYGSIDNYNKTGTYWNDVIGDPTYTGAYTPYTPLYKQKGFADQASYEATLPEYLDNKSGGDTGSPITVVDTKVPSTIVDTKVPSTIVGAVGNDTLTSIIGKDSLTGANGNDSSTSTPNNINLNPSTDVVDQNLYPTNTDKTVSNVYGADPNQMTLTQGTDVVDQNLYPTNTDKTVSNVSGVPTLTDLAVKNGVENYTSAPSSQQQLEDQAVNAGYQGDYTDTAAMQDFLNAKNTNVPSLTDLAVKNGVTNTGTQQISNTTPADKTTASLVSQPSVIQQSQMTPWDQMGITQDNYYENYYAKGGSVHHLAKKYAVGGGPVPQGGTSIADSAMPRPEQGIPQPIEAPAPIAVQAPPQSDSMVQMQEMLKAYGTPSNDYAQELEEARRKSNAETEAFMSMIQKSRKPENDNLSQAELYFRLAAAAGAPTKTGGIAESLSNINREMSDYSKEQVGRRNSDLELQMKAQQLKAANAKEDLNVLRGLAGESMKDRRALISEIIKAQIASGKPLSDAGRMASDLGLSPNTPGYNDFMNKYIQYKLVQPAIISAQNAATSGSQLGVAQGNLNVAQDRYNLLEREYNDKASGVIPPVELRKMEKLASKDQQTVENAAKQVNLIKNDITALKTHPGLSGITGMSGNIYKYPGSDRANAQTALESLQNKLEGYGKVAQSASGAIGAMAVAEWDKMRKQIANIDPVKLGEQGTLKALDNLSSDLDASVSMFKSQYEREHDTALEHNPDKFSLKLDFGKRNEKEEAAKNAGWVLHTDSKGNKAYVNPNNKSEYLEIQ